eukprot:TRINITY_DN9219_c0_g2_i1.p1 TRINITY_DN9219_c0_g2~~TRINITY_DN9219_c0_g2_i1.p1  ORF type:complete len:1207 (+),score=337.59 TRINITY_DN9219_c0_g2_i1:143-3763(+)
MNFLTTGRCLCGLLFIVARAVRVDEEDDALLQGTPGQGPEYGLEDSSLAEAAAAFQQETASRSPQQRRSAAGQGLQAFAQPAEAEASKDVAARAIEEMRGIGADFLGGLQAEGVGDADGLLEAGRSQSSPHQADGISTSAAPQQQQQQQQQQQAAPKEATAAAAVVQAHADGLQEKLDAHHQLMDVQDRLRAEKTQVLMKKAMVGSVAPGGRAECPADTGVSCLQAECPAALLNATCEAGTCLCAPGLCAIGGKCQALPSEADEVANFTKKLDSIRNISAPTDEIAEAQLAAAVEGNASARAKYAKTLQDLRKHSKDPNAHLDELQNSSDNFSQQLNLGVGDLDIPTAQELATELTAQNAVTKRRTTTKEMPQSTSSTSAGPLLVVNGAAATPPVTTAQPSTQATESPAEGAKEDKPTDAPGQAPGPSNATADAPPASEAAKATETPPTQPPPAQAAAQPCNATASEPAKASGGSPTTEAPAVGNAVPAAAEPTEAKAHKVEGAKPKIAESADTAEAPAARKISMMYHRNLARPSDCSGWAPTEGRFAGQGSHCATWGWQAYWCYVREDYKGRKTTSMDYPHKFFAYCDPGEVPLENQTEGTQIAETGEPDELSSSEGEATKPCRRKKLKRLASYVALVLGLIILVLFLRIVVCGSSSPQALSERGRELTALEASYYELMKDMQDQVKFVTEMHVDWLQHYFNQLRQDFVDICRRINANPSRLGDKSADAELASAFGGLTKAWLGSFRECTLDPAGKPLDVVSDMEINFCGSLTSITKLVIERLSKVEVVFIKIQQDMDFRQQSVWQVARDLDASKRERSAELSKVEDCRSCNLCSWVSFCGLSSGYRPLPRSGVFFPLDLNFCYVMRLNVWNCRHLALLVTFVFVHLLAVVHVLLRTHGGLILALLDVAMMWAILLRWEGYETGGRLRATSAVVGRQVAAVKAQKQEVVEVGKLVERPARIWLYRARPKLDVVMAMLRKVSTTSWSSSRSCKDFMEKCLAALERLQEGFGSVREFDQLPHDAQKVCLIQAEKAIAYIEEMNVEQCDKEDLARRLHIPRVLDVRLLECKDLVGAGDEECVVYVRFRSRAEQSWIKSNAVESRGGTASWEGEKGSCQLRFLMRTEEDLLEADVVQEGGGEDLLLGSVDFRQPSEGPWQKITRSLEDTQGGRLTLELCVGSGVRHLATMAQPVGKATMAPAAAGAPEA